MTESTDWAFPTDLQPRAGQVPFDLERTLQAMVKIRSVTPAGAFTASALGTERGGNGVVIRTPKGTTLVLTNGYVVLEASEIWLTTHDARVIPGHVLEFDEVSGLGLILPLGELDVPALTVGSAKGIDRQSPLWILGYGGAAHTTKAQLEGRQTFAAFWEYLLEDGLLVTPLHPEFGGAALVDSSGEVRGIGALVLHSVAGEERFNSNLFVPSDSVMPVLEALDNPGQARRPPLAWLGIYAAEHEGHVTIMGVPDKGPAANAKLHQGDVIVAVAGVPITDLAQMYRTTWSQGPAGCTIELTVKRKDRVRTLPITTIPRTALYMKPRAH